ncbi:hypothetical protein [Basfia succiniciproducens]|uniref:Aldo/keto reductase family protein n=1 Tax=Basfia succiniciproducens TaxID=653940 RepID=A0A1G5EA82_9PAST|nr:hypothetical protein [Basfia succiniciproducens]QIM69281.1 hypothetical protein A4G13_07680 [Basfia succiniciproducens]SCY23418.1 Aldo/keto reductase family protein [Basfia succiniciproducens]
MQIQLNDRLTLSRFSHGYWRAHQWQLLSAQYTQLIENILELGITTFDHAACYGGFTNETAFGKGLANQPSLPKLYLSSAANNSNESATPWTHLKLLSVKKIGSAFTVHQWGKTCRKGSECKRLFFA